MSEDKDIASMFGVLRGILMEEKKYIYFFKADMLSSQELNLCFEWWWGQGEWFTALAAVWVMDTDTLNWPTASNIPHPLSNAISTVFEETVCLAGGVVKSEMAVFVWDSVHGTQSWIYQWSISPLSC